MNSWIRSGNLNQEEKGTTIDSVLLGDGTFPNNPSIIKVFSRNKTEADDEF